MKDLETLLSIDSRATSPAFILINEATSDLIFPFVLLKKRGNKKLISDRSPLIRHLNMYSVFRNYFAFILPISVIIPEFKVVRAELTVALIHWESLDATTVHFHWLKQ